ncbi:MAG: hypothetical protein CL609_02425 [Anaerolineaceae bacterium]|nr:hypothetical protein [Anaerolineaceae bacterium]
MKQNNKVGLISIGLPYFDYLTAEKHLKNTRSLLEKEWAVFGPEKTITDNETLDNSIQQFKQEPDLAVIVLQIGTFPDGETPLKIAEQLKLPVIIHSLPEPDIDKKVSMNSLCGANLSTFTLTAIKLPHTFIHGDPLETSVQEGLKSRVRAVLSLNELRQSRLALIGFRAPGFYPSSFDELLLRRTFGVAMDYIDLGEIKEAFRSGKTKKAPVDSFPAIEGGSLSKVSINMMEQHYAALSSVFEKSGLNLFAIRDWPELFDVEAPAGLWPALGWLQDDGYLIGPEGDVNAAVTMKLGHALTNGTPFFADVSGWKDEDSSLVLWHYGGAPSLAKNKDEILFGMEGREVEFTLKPGKATLMRVGMFEGTFRLLGICGEIVDKPIQIGRAGGYFHTSNTPAGEVIHHILENGWEHHYILFYGDLSTELKTIAKLTGLSLTLL